MPRGVVDIASEGEHSRDWVKGAADRRSLPAAEIPYVCSLSTPVARRQISPVCCCCWDNDAQRRAPRYGPCGTARVDS